MTVVAPRFPLLYQIDTRVVVHEAAAARGGEPARGTLDDLPDDLLDGAAARGFSWLWPLGVWQTGPIGRRLARAPAAMAGYRNDLPDVREDDLVGSPFAITGYQVDRDLGGDGALGRLRERLGRRGLALLVDFVPNHVALDHPWAAAHPEYFVEGGGDDLAREPESWARVDGVRGCKILAHGRDPYFPPWTDTLQLNHRHAGLRQALLAELERVADRADGVRCDMAMLLLPDVFARVWGAHARPADGTPPLPDDRPFWPEAIARVRRRHPDFVFVAEVYWGLEARLLSEGFDFSYDKGLMDLLRDGTAAGVREHLSGELVASGRGVHFLENHDEARAAAAFSPERHRAAAVIALLAPGLRLVYEGQLEGRKRRAPIQLDRRAVEPVDADLRAFYDRLLGCLGRPELGRGTWRLGTTRAAEGGDASSDALLVFSWKDDAGHRLLAAVNFSPAPARGFARFDLGGLPRRRWRLRELLAETPAASASGETRDGEAHDSEALDGEALARDGLPVDLPPWGYRVLALEP